MKIEQETKNGIPERPWGFRQPTVLIESQSAPVLLGDPAEQAYLRANVLAGQNDLVVTDFPLNPTYHNQYLGQTLGFDQPEHLVVQNGQGDCLSEKLLDNKPDQDRIHDWARRNGVNPQIQYFSVTDAERELTKQLNLPSSSGNIEETINVGSKPGFRRFCEENDIPIPDGYICDDAQSTLNAARSLLSSTSEVLIKSENGTGGNDLLSNISVTREEFENLDDRRQHGLIAKKLSFFQSTLGNEWVVEQKISGVEGSVHVHISDDGPEKPFVLGTLSENDSYVGGYYPPPNSPETQKMVEIVENVAAEALHQRGVRGPHCFDYINGKFIEDNARHGALDFIDGITRRIAQIHFPNQPYAYVHTHKPISSPTSFDRVWEKFKDELDPSCARDNCFMVVTNPEVLPHGRSLDLTSVSFGPDASLDKAKEHFETCNNNLRRNL